MGKQLTQEEYIERLKERNPNLELIGQYVNSDTKVLVKCKLCGYIRESIAYNLISKRPRKCPKCNKRLQITHDDYINEIEEIHQGRIIVLGKYINKSTRILHKCTVCGYEWNVAPIKLTAPSCKTACPFCAGNIGKTNDKYIKELQDKKIPLIPLENYINTHTLILHKCLICGTERKCSPHNVLAGRICPVCNTSKGENKINEYLSKEKINFIRQYRFDNCINQRALPFDFYLPDCNVCIEYDGELHYKAVDYFGGEETLKSTQMRDNIKTNYCKEHNIRLIRIPYWDFDNIEEILNKELEVV